MNSTKYLVYFYVNSTYVTDSYKSYLLEFPIVPKAFSRNLVDLPKNYISTLLLPIHKPFLFIFGPVEGQSQHSVLESNSEV